MDVPGSYQMVCKWLITYNLLINGTYILGLFHPLIRSPLIHPLPSRDIQVGHPDNLDKVGPLPGVKNTPEI